MTVSGEQMSPTSSNRINLEKWQISFATFLILSFLQLPLIAQNITNASVFIAERVTEFEYDISNNAIFEKRNSFFKLDDYLFLIAEVEQDFILLKKFDKDLNFLEHVTLTWPKKFKFPDKVLSVFYSNDQLVVHGGGIALEFNKDLKWKRFIEVNANIYNIFPCNGAYYGWWTNHLDDFKNDKLFIEKLDLDFEPVCAIQVDQKNSILQAYLSGNIVTHNKDKIIFSAIDRPTIFLSNFNLSEIDSIALDIPQWHYYNGNLTKKDFQNLPILFSNKSVSKISSILALRDNILVVNIILSSSESMEVIVDIQAKEILHTNFISAPSLWYNSPEPVILEKIHFYNQLSWCDKLDEYFYMVVDTPGGFIGEVFSEFQKRVESPFKTEKYKAIIIKSRIQLQ